MEPNVILVDPLDNELGVLEKSMAHLAPHLHRAFSVFLHDGTRMLVQQRALEKYHSGGLWANTCCSHPRPGEDLTSSAVSRLYEETGIRCADLNHQFEFTYIAKFDEFLYEYEYDHVFLGKYDGSFTPNPLEVEQMCWVECADLLLDLRVHPHKYAPWFLICAPKIIPIILEQ